MEACYSTAHDAFRSGALAAAGHFVGGQSSGRSWPGQRGAMRREDAPLSEFGWVWAQLLVFRAI
jgi:hypothetical protein